MLHPRTVDPHNFVNVLNSLNSEADRQAVLDMCTSVKSVKARKGRSREGTCAAMPRGYFTLLTHT